MSKVVIFGAGQSAEIVYSCLSTDSSYEVVAFTVDKSCMNNNELFGLPIIPFENIEHHYSPKKFKMFVAMSYQDLNKLRARKYEEAKNKGYELVSYIHSKASVSSGAIIGDNCFIMDYAILQPFVKVGNNVSIWSGTLIGHHAQIGDHCWVTSEVCIAGNTIIKPYCFIGVNTTIGHLITIEKENFIGAGCLITKNTKEKSVYIAKDTEPYRLDSAMFLKFTKME